MPDAKPEEKSINTREVWTNLVRVLAVRLALLSLLLGASSLLLPDYGGAFHVFVGLAFMLTIPYSLWIRDHVRLHELSYLQFLVDVVVVTGLVYFTGGMRSGLVLLYPLVIVAAGIVSPWWRAMQIAVLCVLAYSTLAVLGMERVLVPYAGEVASQGYEHGLVIMVLHGMTFLLFGVAGAFMSRRCLYLEPSEQPGELDRWRSAAAMASQMAHEVRNPVAAISGCAQVLDHMEKRSAQGDLRSAQMLVDERARLHQCIVDESARLDRIIEKFLNHAEFTEEKLARLMELSRMHATGPITAPAAAKEPVSSGLSVV